MFCLIIDYYQRRGEMRIREMKQVGVRHCGLWSGKCLGEMTYINMQTTSVEFQDLFNIGLLYQKRDGEEGGGREGGTRLFPPKASVGFPPDPTSPPPPNTKKNIWPNSENRMNCTKKKLPCPLLEKQNHTPHPPPCFFFF